MSTCRLCSWDISPDDEVLRFPSGSCLCLRCFHHNCADERPVSKRLQHEIAVEEDNLRGMKLPVDGRLLRLREGLS